MAMPARGHKGYWQAGLQTVWGTAVVPTGWRLPFLNFQMKPNLSPELDESMSAGYVDVREQFTTGELFEIEIEGYCYYAGLLKIFHMICGDHAANPTTPAVSAVDGNGLYTHTLLMGENLPFYTIQQNEGEPGGNVAVARYDSVVARRLVIGGRAVQGREGALRYKLSVWARSVQSATATALNLVPSRAVLYKHATTVDDGSGDANQRVKRWELSIERALEYRPYFGSSASDQFLPDRHPQVQMTWEADWQSGEQFSDYIDQVVQQPRMVLTGPDLVGAAGARSWDFFLGRAKTRELEGMDVNKYGALTRTVRHQGLRYDTDMSALKVIIKTDNATIAAG